MKARLAGNNHVNLTVSDLGRSTEWYCRIFDLAVVSTDQNIGPPYFTDVWYRGLFDLSTRTYVVGLIQHRDPVEGRFDERRVGLDHFGLQVRDATDLPHWVAHLDEQGVHHSGVIDSPYATVVSFRDPDGIALELSATKAAFWASLVSQAG